MPGYGTVSGVFQVQNRSGCLSNIRKFLAADVGSPIHAIEDVAAIILERIPIGRSVLPKNQRKPEITWTAEDQVIGRRVVRVV